MCLIVPCIYSSHLSIVTHFKSTLYNVIIYNMSYCTTGCNLFLIKCKKIIKKYIYIYLKNVCMRRLGQKHRPTNGEVAWCKRLLSSPPLSTEVVANQKQETRIVIYNSTRHRKTRHGRTKSLPAKKYDENLSISRKSNCCQRQ